MGLADIDSVSVTRTDHFAVGQLIMVEFSMESFAAPLKIPANQKKKKR